MKQLAGIIGATVLGLILTFGMANAQSSSPHYGYGGQNCPWSYGAGGKGYGPSYKPWRNTAAITGTNYRNNRHTTAPRYYRHGAYCSYGPRYGSYGR